MIKYEDNSETVTDESGGVDDLARKKLKQADD